MSSLTQTATELSSMHGGVSAVPRQNTVLTVQQKTLREKAKSAFDELQKILLSSGDWLDDLSQHLFRWGSDVSLECLDSPLAEAPLLQLVQQRIQTLVKDILVHPITRFPLNSPYLDRTWIWEERLLKCHLSSGDTRSIYDGQLIQAISHTFAQQMIAWVKNLPSEIWSEEISKAMDAKAKSEASTGLVIRRDSPESQMLLAMQGLAHVIITQNAKMNEHNIKMTEELRNQTRHITAATHGLQELGKELADDIAEHKERTERTFKEHVAATAANIATLEQRQEQWRNIVETNFKNQFDQVNQKLAQTDRRLTETEREAANQKQINAEQARLSAERQRELEDLKQKLKDEKNRCIIC